MHIASSDAFVKIWILRLEHPFSKKSRYSNLVLISFNSEHQSLKISSVLLTTLRLMLVPLLPRCFWVETACIWWRVNISQVGRNTAEPKDRTILWVNFAETSCLVPLWDCLCLQSNSVHRLMIVVVRPRNFSQLLLICLLLGFVTWLLRHLLYNSSNWIHLY